MLCDRAFEAGCEVQNLLDASQQAPALGDVLNVRQTRSLAALRLLWSLRATRPWDKLGDLSTVFELAPDSANAAILAERPDLLLWFRDPRVQVSAETGRGKMGPATIQFTPSGVWLQDVLFVVPPRVFEVRLRSSGSELKLGDDLFRSPEDLDPLSQTLDRWFRYTFHDFLPQVDRVLTWRSPQSADVLRAWGARACPECAGFLLPRVGEVGLAIESGA
jgi:hypothetical protein